MEAKDTITLVVGILAFVGVVATIVVASWTATSSANADRALQTRTQLRQAALAPLDKLREQLNDRIRDRQKQLAHLHADKDIVGSVHEIIEKFVNERSSLPSDLSSWFPAAMALEPPRFEETRVFTLAEAQASSGEKLMAELQAYWRWWHLYDGLLAQRNKNGVDRNALAELDKRAWEVLENRLMPSTEELPRLFARKIDSLEQSLSALALCVAHIDNAEQQILALTDEVLILRQASDVTKAARSSLLDDIAPTEGAQSRRA